MIYCVSVSSGEPCREIVSGISTCPDFLAEGVWKYFILFAFSGLACHLGFTRNGI